jgi:hypothetical protein
VTIAAGSFAVNWRDKKIFVGSGGELPILFSQKLEDWDQQRLYRKDDLTIYQSQIWRALVDIPPNSGFSTSSWEQISVSGPAASGEPLSSDIMMGGAVTRTVGLGLSVTAGRGVVVDNSTEPPVYTEVAWGQFLFDGTYQNEPWSVIAINATGAVVQLPLSAWGPEERRDHIQLAFVLWRPTPSIVRIVDASVRAGGTAETYIDEYLARGGPYRTAGGRASGVPGTLGITTSAGKVFSMGGAWRQNGSSPNVINISAIAQIKVTRTSQNGIVDVDQNFGNPALWDNGGALTAVPGSSYTIQYLSATPDFSTFLLRYGHEVYASEQEAIAAIQMDYETLPSAPEVLAPTIMLSAIIARGDAANYDNARFVNAFPGLDPFTTYGQEVNTDGFYLLSGSRALTGDMDAGGNSILDADINGDESKIRVKRSGTTGSIPATTTSADAGELTVNYTDRKVYIKDATGAAVLVADRISDYSASRQYVVGDFCIQSDTFYRCVTAITTPEAFNVANWLAIGGGGGGGGDISGAVILEPESAGRNIISTVGEAGIEPLRVRGDPLQSVDLQVWEPTQASDGGKLNVNSLGFPGPRFGSAAFRAGVATHPFTAIGQPIGFNGNWVLPAGNAPTYGLLQEVIDVNTVVIRQAGIIENLSTAAFAGGVIDPATLYYPSTTTPGQLTPIQPAGVNAVLLTTSTTAGLVLTASAAVGFAGATVGDAFPPSPADGDLHYRTSGVAGLYVFFQDTDSSQWVQANGGVANDIQEYHDPARLASWRITKNTLEVWGTASTGVDGNRLIACPKVFDGACAVTATIIGASVPAGSMFSITGQTTGPTLLSFQARTFGGASVTVAAAAFSYHAIGKWDGVS